MSCPTLVSVIIPTWNRSSLLSRAVSSVLAQTYKNIEIIVVDDCSNDNTSSILASYGSSVRTVHTPSRCGPAAARNLGLSTAQGDIIAFLDSDDWWHPQKLTKQVPLLVDSETGVVYCDAINVDPTDKAISRQCSRYRGRILDQMLVENVVCGSASAAIMRHSCIENSAPFRADIYREDWDLWLRLSFDYKFDYIPEPLVYITVDSSSRHHTISPIAAGSSITAIYQALLDNPRTADYVATHKAQCGSTLHFYTGIILWQNGLVADARAELWQSIRLDPTQVRSYREYIKTFLGDSTLDRIKSLRMATDRLRGRI